SAIALSRSASSSKRASLAGDLRLRGLCRRHPATVRDHPGMQIRNRGAAGPHEEEWQQSVYEAGESGEDHPDAEAGGLDEMFGIALANTGGVISKKGAELIHAANNIRPPPNRFANLTPIWHGCGSLFPVLAYF